MAVETPPAELGAPCPDFRLPGVDGRSYARDDFAAAPVLVVMFICNHCPYVKAVEDRLDRASRASTEPRGVQLVGHLRQRRRRLPRRRASTSWASAGASKSYGFPYLHDESQDVARAFGAVCTPDIFVYDSDRRLAYRGRIDDSWKDRPR